MDEPYNVEDFICEVLERDGEWGSIRIVSSSADEQVCDYRYGEADTSHLHKRTLHAKVKSAKANGGWSAMSYILYV